MVQRMPNLAGMTPWVLMDFRSPSRMLPGVQDYHNRKGLISNRGERKLAFYMLQEFYKNKAGASKIRKIPNRSPLRTLSYTKENLCLRAVLKFFVPRHLDRFQLAFV